MMANRDIVSEAVEQAEAMKQAAYENAKNVLVEAMSTNLQAAVAEAIDEKLDTEDVEISEEVVAEETVEEGAHDTDEMEDKEEMAHMDELEDEDEDDDDDDEEVDIDIDIDADGDDDDDEDEEELDEVDLDEVIEIVEDEDEVDEGEHEDADEGEDLDEEDDEDVEEIGKMYKEAVAEVESLRTENKRYAKALKVLRTRIEEVNLFNARLAAATDVMNQVTLTKEQKERVVEHFDSCDTLDEVTRMAGVLKEAHETTTPSKNRTQRPNVQSVISENKTEAPGGFDRLAQLAGL
tara:strand:- start:4704 stop:5582 length:879 start_codon:yes stop_codon:yes gene_type:complete